MFDFANIHYYQYFCFLSIHAENILLFIIFNDDAKRLVKKFIIFIKSIIQNKRQILRFFNHVDASPPKPIFILIYNNPYLFLLIVSKCLLFPSFSSRINIFLIYLFLSLGQHTIPIHQSMQQIINEYTHPKRINALLTLNKWKSTSDLECLPIQEKQNSNQRSNSNKKRSKASAKKIESSITNKASSMAGNSLARCKSQTEITSKHFKNTQQRNEEYGKSEDGKFEHEKSEKISKNNKMTDHIIQNTAQKQKKIQFSTNNQIQRNLYSNFEGQFSENVKIRSTQYPFQNSCSALSSANSPKAVRFNQKIIQNIVNPGALRQRQKFKSPENSSILRKSSLKKSERSSVNNSSVERSFSSISPSKNGEKQHGKILTSTQISKQQRQSNHRNKIIKDKYDTILKKLKQKSDLINGGKRTAINSKFSSYNYYKNGEDQHFLTKKCQKFTDDIFPPVYSSLFSLSNPVKGKKKIGNEIIWKRIPQIFQNKKIVLRNKLGRSKINLHTGIYGGQYFALVLNTIKNNKKLLDLLFQSQDVSPYGIYIVKIFQQNAWKYIIVDDFVPVKPSKQAFESVFLQIQSEQGDESVQIWPLLLQKALANYYSTYEALRYGNVIDFLEEITGSGVVISDLEKKKINNFSQTKNTEISRENHKSNNKIIIQTNNKKQQQIPKQIYGEDTQQKALNQKQLQQLMKNQDNIFLFKSQNKFNQGEDFVYFPVLPQDNNFLRKNAQYCIYSDPLQNYAQKRIKIKDCLQLFWQIIVVCPQKYEHLTTSHLLPHIATKASANRSNYRVKMEQPNSINIIPQSRSQLNNINFKNNIKTINTLNTLNNVNTVNTLNNINSQNTATSRQSISLRYFKVQSTSNISLSVRQKQFRFYHQNCMIYSYIWLRVILLSRQYDGSYRWIHGQYSNKKSINFMKNALEPGQYFVLLMPEWRSAHSHEITILLRSDKQPLQIQRREYKQDEQMLEKGCADLAQRQGKLHQINKFICSYNYVSVQTGLIIENIHNERLGGPVTIMRSIRGLKSQVEIIPVNKQFYHQQTGNIGNISNINNLINPLNNKNNSKSFNTPENMMKDTIEIDIPKNQHYTVILRCKGGLDYVFLKAFDFGG